MALHAVQSTLHFFIFTHHSPLSISGAHAKSINNNTANDDVEMFFLSRLIDMIPSGLIDRIFVACIAPGIAGFSYLPCYYVSLIDIAVVISNSWLFAYITYDASSIFPVICILKEDCT